MILFYSDWIRFPRAIIHHRTKNKSFLKLAEIYRRMGIKNYAFCLTLLNPELELVDPHSKDLTDEQKTLIALECMFNPWYFFREVLKIPPRGAGEPMQFEAKRGNIALIWLYLNHIDSSLTQPRQTGKTTGAHAISIYLMIILCEHSMINLLTKDDKLRTESIKDLKRMRSYLPPYLRFESNADSDNTISFDCKMKDNYYVAAVSQNSEAAALNLGRGLTSATKHIDEGPFINFIDVAIPALLSSGNAAREIAKKNDLPYGNYFTTTAGKKDTRSGMYMYKMIHGGMFFSEILYDTKTQEHLKEVVRKGSPGIKAMVNITMSHRQLGYSDQWLYDAMSETNSTGDDANRDYFNIWTSGGLSSPVPVEILERIRNSEREPMYTELCKENYVIRWYVPYSDIPFYMQNRRFVMGMDTANAVGKDSITLVMLDDQTLDVVASLNVNETNVALFVQWLAQFMIKYKNVTLIPENKGPSQVMIDLLVNLLQAAGIDPFKRIYNLIVDNHLEHAEEYKVISYEPSRRSPQFYDKVKKYFGYTTSAGGYHGRDNLYIQTLLRAGSLGCDKCYDKPLIDEITGLVTKNGRIDHSDGNHDDLVIAWLLGVWFLTTSKNLQFYGHTNVLSKAKEFKVTQDKRSNEDDVIDHYKQQQQEQIRIEIEGLLEQIRNSPDDIITRMLELRIRTLDSRLTTSYSEQTTIDAILGEITASRNKNIRDRMNARRTNQGVFDRRSRDLRLAA